MNSTSSRNDGGDDGGGGGDEGISTDCFVVCLNTPYAEL